VEFVTSADIGILNHILAAFYIFAY